MSDMKEKVFEGEKATLRFREGWCKNCAICVAFCPTDALEMVNERLSIQPEHCIGCGKCELRCPDFAIIVQRKTSNKQTSGNEDSEETP